MSQCVKLSLINYNLNPTSIELIQDIYTRKIIR